jgi:acyl-homoserine-lactone acylase
MRIPGSGTRGQLAGLIAVITALLAPAVAPAATRYHVKIRRTAHGIPHILAKDYGSLGYGYGYALAQDNICVVADTYITVDAERSRFFGPDANYASRGNSTTPNNLNSDFFFKRIIDEGTVEKLLAQEPPAGPVPEIKEAVRGYVAGYNAYLKRTGVDKLPDPTCRGKDWVRPIKEIDAYRRFYQLALLASAGVAVDGIGNAQPLVPVGADQNSPQARDAVARATARQQHSLENMNPQRFDELMGQIGSNAVALGKSATVSGHGLLLGNPHFPWDGPERFYEAQLTIPGKVDVAGASLYAVPVINIGFTKGLAWSHTVSTARRFTPFQLTLVPGDPTSYLVDGQPHTMKATKLTVMARTPDGKLVPRTRTLYETEYGPMITAILGLPIFPWTPVTAFAMGDVNAANFRYLNHFYYVNKAQSVAELDAIEKRYLGIPWVNTIAADTAGHAYYADIGAVPNVSNAKIQTCSSPLGYLTDQALRVQVLDGARGSCAWDNDPDAIAKGIFGPSHLPSLTRDDYVTNSNDSYWLSNPAQPLEGFSRVIGDERTARATRTRLGLRIVQQRLDGSDGLPGKGFTLEQLKDAVFNNRQYLGELWRDSLVQLCQSTPMLMSSNGPVDVSGGCAALKNWDLHDNLDSKGAILFRRFASRALSSPLPVNLGVPSPWLTPFSASDPVNTPNGLNIFSPAVQQSLADAVNDLKGAGIPLDAPLRGWEYEKRGDEKIPIHGGPGGVGVFNAINVSWNSKLGYPDVPHGSSYVQAVELTGGCPQARTILTYSLSSNPDSPYFADQTRMFSNKEWITFPFCARDIARDKSLKVTELGKKKAKKAKHKHRRARQRP